MLALELEPLYAALAKERQRGGQAKAEAQTPPTGQQKRFNGPGARTVSSTCLNEQRQEGAILREIEGVRGLWASSPGKRTHISPGKMKDGCPLCRMAKRVKTVQYHDGKGVSIYPHSYTPTGQDEKPTKTYGATLDAT